MIQSTLTSKHQTAIPFAGEAASLSREKKTQPVRSVEEMKAAVRNIAGKRVTRTKA